MKAPDTQEITPGSDSLSAEEQNDLLALEATIEAGQETFLQVGAALLAIRDRGLYRERFETFDAYVNERWNFSRQRAYQLMDAAGIGINVSTVVDTKKLNERQLRELTPLGPDEQRVAVRLVKLMSPEGRITTAALKSTASALVEIATTGAISDEDGDQHPWHELDEEGKLALMLRHASGEQFETIQRKRDHIRRALTSSASVEWYTPPKYVDAARRALGGTIDLDPASCAQANLTVGATRYYTAEHDGLRHDWHGHIFMNPPYSGLAGDFVAHLLNQYRSGNVIEAVVLLNGNATDTQWFRPLFDWPICFAGRLQFISPDGPGTQATHGSVFVYVGSDVDRFVEVFGAFGPVVRDIRSRQDGPGEDLSPDCGADEHGIGGTADDQT